MAFWNFNEFVDAVAEKIPEVLTDIEIEDIRIEPVTKNNGIQCTGLLILREGYNVAPNLYMEPYYSMYQASGSFDNVLNMIANDYTNAMKQAELINATSIHEDYPEKVILKLVNTELNKDALKNCPHIEMNDLSYTFRYIVKDDGIGIASALVTYNDIDRWGLSSEELFDMAKENTRRIFPPVIRDIREFIPDINDFPFEIDEDRELFVLTNDKGINGATSMIFTNVIDEFSQQRNNVSFYIIPSSIHEVLLIKKSDGLNIETLADLVKEVNRFVVGEMDFLSDNLYEYDAASKEITQCSGIEKEIQANEELEL